MLVLAMLAALISGPGDTYTESSPDVIEGTRRLRVLLVDFEDREGRFSREDYEQLIFSKGTLRELPDAGNEVPGSVRDYFLDVSGGRLDIVGEVSDWRRLELDWRNLPYWTDGPVDWWQIVALEAMKAHDIPADDTLDGEPVDGYCIIFGGNAMGMTEGRKSVVWGAVRREMSGEEYRRLGIDGWEQRFDGKQIIMCCDSPGSTGRIAEIGTICHELGHLFAQCIDLYNPGGGEFRQWALMANGDRTYTPVSMIAWHRFHAGWLDYTVARPGDHEFSLPPLTRSNQAIRLPEGFTMGAPYLVLENRRREGLDKGYLPDQGLLVYRACEENAEFFGRWDSGESRFRSHRRVLEFLRCDDDISDTRGDEFPDGPRTYLRADSSPSSATGLGDVFWAIESIGEAEDGAVSFEARYQPLRIGDLVDEATWENDAGEELQFGRDEPGGREAGSVALCPSLRMEDGELHRDVLWMHPRWADQGELTGRLSVPLPEDAGKVMAEVGLREGAARSDGVTFEIGAVMPGGEATPLVRKHATYDGRLDHLVADVSHLAGTGARLYITVDACGSSGQDWAAWTRLEVVPKAEFARDLLRELDEADLRALDEDGQPMGDTASPEWRENADSEDLCTYGRALSVLAPGAGGYEIASPLEVPEGGCVLRAQVGYLQDPRGDGQAKIEVRFDVGEDEDDRTVILGDLDNYQPREGEGQGNGALFTLEADLSRFAGDEGTLVLSVVGEPFEQIVWTEAKLYER